MDMKEWVCRACGCKFEAEKKEDTGREVKKDVKAQPTDAELAPCCPECKSYDIQSA